MDSSLLNWEVRASLPYPVLHNSIRARIGSLRVLLVVNCACGCEESFSSKVQNGDGGGTQDVAPVFMDSVTAIKCHPKFPSRSISHLAFIMSRRCPCVIQSLFTPLIDLLYTEADTAMDDLLLYTNSESAVESLFSFHPKYSSSLVPKGL